MNDPELKAMAAVYDALNGLDANTRQRVTDWVLAKMNSSTSATSTKGAKRGRKPGTKKAAKSVAAKAPGAKRGRKPGTKKAGAKRGPKTGAAKTTAKPAKKTGKRGRPAGSGKKAAKKVVAKAGSSRRGRPAKAAVVTA